MDPNTLEGLLAQRAMQAQAPEPTPVVPPSGGHTHTPPQLQRFTTAQQMMDGYRNGWTPNPILLRAANGHR